MSTPVYKDPADYLLEHFEAVPTRGFLVALDMGTSTNLTKNAPGKPQEVKDSVTKAVSDLRDSIDKDEEMTAFLFDFRSKIPLHKPHLLSGNPWKAKFALANLYKEWIATRKKYKLSVPAEYAEFDTYPTPPSVWSTHDSNFTKAAKDAKVPDKVPDGGALPRRVYFPENFDLTASIGLQKLVISQYVESNFKPISAEKLKERDEAFAALGLGILPSVDGDSAYWLDEARELEAEKVFVKDKKRLSVEFSRKLEKVKEKLKEGEAIPNKYQEVLNELKSSGNLEPPVIPNSDGDGEKGTGGRKFPKKSLYADLLAHAQRLAMKNKDKEFVEIPPVEPIFPKLTFAEFKKVVKVRPAPAEGDKFETFLKVPLPGKITAYAGSDKIRNLEFDNASILTFIKENQLDANEEQDVIYATVMCRLVDAGIINYNNPAKRYLIEEEAVPEAAEGESSTPRPANEPVLPKADVEKFLSPGKKALFEKYARRMLDAAFYYGSQGANDGVLSWYESHMRVFGKVTSERRFITICELINASGSLAKYVRKLTVDEVRNASEVLKYRLSRISTPTLIFQALSMITNDFILRMIDPVALEEYYRFVKGGILAQLAAGPLKVYLDGDYDPTMIKGIPGDTPVGDLKPISEPPYNAKLIKQAKIILDIYNYDAGKWYQGDKAIKNLDTHDIYFREVVRAVRSIDQERIRFVAEALAQDITMGDFGLDDNMGPVKGFIQTYSVHVAPREVIDLSGK